MCKNFPSCTTNTTMKNEKMLPTNARTFQHNSNVIINLRFISVVFEGWF